MSWSTLSEDLWKRILDYVPLADRLRFCSTVNKTLYRAAAAATSAVAACDVSRERLPGLCQWMTHHGQHLNRLQLNITGGTLTQLPCPNLRELDLAYIWLQLDASSSQPGVLNSCMRLTKLRFYKCRYIDSRSSLTALSALVGLQHLQLADDIYAADEIWMPSAVLQHLPHLTYLLLHNGNIQVVDGSCLEHISCLTSLQELHIASAGLVNEGVYPSLSPDTTPGLSRLAALQRVNLRGIHLDPLILQDCTQLQGLELQLVSIISAGGAAALHILLGRLQQLQFLQLYELEYAWPVAAAAYTNLTASSLLQELHLHVDDMPAGIWPHVFPPSRQLPALRELTFSCYVWDAANPQPAAAQGTDDLRCIAACCPGLCSISITVQPDMELSDLAKASSLTSLSVSGLHGAGLESLQALSGLDSLQKLSVELGEPMAPQDLLCLTALTGLEWLTIPNPEMAPAFDAPPNSEFALWQGWGSDFPVWLQLLEHCGSFSQCQPLIFKGLGQLLLEQQQRHTQQEQQVAAQQQQITVLQARLQAALSGQQQRTAELQEQLASTRAQAASSQAAAASAAAEAGELRGRLQALEGQVQQLLQAMQRHGG